MGNTNVTLVGTIDTIKAMEKYNVSYSYDCNENVYIVSKDEFARVLAEAKNKKYIKNLVVGATNVMYTGSKLVIA